MILKDNEEHDASLYPLSRVQNCPASKNIAERSSELPSVFVTAHSSVSAVSRNCKTSTWSPGQPPTCSSHHAQYSYRMRTTGREGLVRCPHSSASHDVAVHAISVLLCPPRTGHLP